MKADNRANSMEYMRRAKFDYEQAKRDGRTADALYHRDTVVLIWRTMKTNGWL